MVAFHVSPSGLAYFPKSSLHQYKHLLFQEVVLIGMILWPAGFLSLPLHLGALQETEGLLSWDFENTIEKGLFSEVRAGVGEARKDNKEPSNRHVQAVTTPRPGV